MNVSKTLRQIAVIALGPVIVGMWMLGWILYWIGSKPEPQKKRRR